MLEKLAYRLIRENVSMIVSSMKKLLDLGQTSAEIATYILNEFIREVEEQLEEPVQESEENKNGHKT